jgi:hypothetical protein
VAPSIQNVVSELKHHFVTQEITEHLDEPGVFKHAVYKITTILNNSKNALLWSGGTRWHIWLRHCATNRKVAGSIPDSVNGIFH